MMCPVGLNVLALLTESYTVVDGAVEHRKVGRQVLQQSRLLIGVLNLEELIELLSRDLERRWDDGHGREDRLVVRPYEEYKANVVEYEQDEGFQP